MRTLFTYLLLIACIATGASGWQAGTPASASEKSKSAKIAESPEIRIPVAHLHEGFIKLTFCYGHVVVTRDTVEYLVEKSEEGQNFEKDKHHGFRVRPDEVEVVGTVVLKEHGPEGVDLRAHGKKLTLFEADWTKMETITPNNRPIIRPLSAGFLMVLKGLVPLPEASPKETATELTPEATGTATVELGQTPEQVEAALGKPEKVVNLGSKRLYVYKDMKITFVDGKVTDVQ